MIENKFLLYCRLASVKKLAVLQLAANQNGKTLNYGLHKISHMACSLCTQSHIIRNLKRNTWLYTCVYVCVSLIHHTLHICMTSAKHVQLCRPISESFLFCSTINQTNCKIDLRKWGNKYIYYSVWYFQSENQDRILHQNI